MQNRLQQLSDFVQNAGRRVLAGRDGQPDLPRIRHAMVELVLDCEHRRAMRIKAHVDAARTVQQLWLLRSEIYQLVSEVHGQFEAQQRVTSLQPLFDGWVPRDKLRAA